MMAKLQSCGRCVVQYGKRAVLRSGDSVAMALVGSMSQLYLGTAADARIQEPGTGMGGSKHEDIHKASREAGLLSPVSHLAISKRGRGLKSKTGERQ